MSFQPDELTFDEGDTLYILDTKDKDWWKAKCGRNTGLIPSNYGLYHVASIFLFDDEVMLNVLRCQLTY